MGNMTVICDIEMLFKADLTVFNSPIFLHWTYLINVIPETRRASLNLISTFLLQSLVDY